MCSNIFGPAILPSLVICPIKITGVAVSFANLISSKETYNGLSTIANEIIEQDKIAHKGYKFLFDLLKVLPRTVEIEQFGYVFKNREFGDSKIGKKQMWEFFKSLF